MSACGHVTLLPHHTMDQQQHHSQIMKETSRHLSWKAFTQQGERKMNCLHNRALVFEEMSAKILWLLHIKLAPCLEILQQCRHRSFRMYPMTPHDVTIKKFQAAQIFSSWAEMTEARMVTHSLSSYISAFLITISQKSSIPWHRLHCFFSHIKTHLQFTKFMNCREKIPQIHNTLMKGNPLKLLQSRQYSQKLHFLSNHVISHTLKFHFFKAMEKPCLFLLFLEASPTWEKPTIAPLAYTQRHQTSHNPLPPRHPHSEWAPPKPQTHRFIFTLAQRSK
jgi:hypothetical protein